MASKSGAKRPSGPGRLSAELAADLPDRLLDAAESLFSEKGYAGTSMESIARRAGASTKTIYSRHADKGEILQAVARRIIDRTVEAHKAELVAAPHDIEPRRFLVSLGIQITQTLNKRAAGLNRLVLSQAYQHPALIELFHLVLAQGTGLIREVLARWKTDGLFTHMPNVEKASLLCFAILTDHMRIRSLVGQPMTNAECEAHISYAVEVFLRGCGYTPKPRK
jgi:TetR/AcrR family transcriptional repressor of mexJK operon